MKNSQAMRKSTTNANRRKLSAAQIILRVVIGCGALLAAGVVTVLATNLYVKGTTRDRIAAPGEPLPTGEFDAIIVLGCSVLPDGTPSHMLADRVETAVELSKNVNARCILMSGDRSEGYDEVKAMKQLALELGADAAALEEDPEGFSTFESILRAAREFGYQRVLIVTQRYHLYRALYIADRLGLEAYGVSADVRTYGGQTFRDVREIAARVKDAFKCWFY